MLHCANEELAEDPFILTRHSLLVNVQELAVITKVALVRTTNVPLAPCELSTIRCTLLKALTAQAILYRLLSTDPDARRLAAESALELVQMTDQMTEEEYNYIEAVPAVSILFLQKHCCTYNRPGDRCAGQLRQAF